MTALEKVSLKVGSGEVVGVVGESGCGKSVLALSIMRLFEPDSGARLSGSVHFAGDDLLTMPENRVEKVRGRDIAMIFQDAMTSLNPVFSIGSQIMEPLMTHRGFDRRAARHKAVELLQLVGISSPETRIDQHPHELSGGMRQRVMIAIAMACSPKLLIADEPTTALDVTIQAQVLLLLDELRQNSQMSIILITHELGIVVDMCDRVVVMYLGEIVEEIEVERLFDGARHPYTIGLISAMPVFASQRAHRLTSIPGNVPALTDVPAGCRFAARCAWAEDRCTAIHPDLISLDGQHQVRCLKHEEIREAECQKQ